MTCIILSGGNGERIGGLDKAFLTIGGETFIERKIRQLTPLFEEIVVVVKEIEPYAHLPVRIIADQIPGLGPLAGLCTGLKASSSNINFVTTVDSPFFRPKLASWLLDEIGDFDAHVPRHGEFTEPLFAVYRRCCIPAIERSHPRRRVISFYEYINVKYAEDEIIRTLDPQHSCFVNINSKEEYQQILNTFS